MPKTKIIVSYININKLDCRRFRCSLVTCEHKLTSIDMLLANLKKYTNPEKMRLLHKKRNQEKQMLFCFQSSTFVAITKFRTNIFVWGGNTYWLQINSAECTFFFQHQMGYTHNYFFPLVLLQIAVSRINETVIDSPANFNIMANPSNESQIFKQSRSIIG